MNFPYGRRFARRRGHGNGHAAISRANWEVTLFPYAAVVVVLTIWGSTRMPAAVGESYESEE